MNPAAEVAKEARRTRNDYWDLAPKKLEVARVYVPNASWLRHLAYLEKIEKRRIS